MMRKIMALAAIIVLLPVFATTVLAADEPDAAATAASSSSASAIPSAASSLLFGAMIGAATIDGVSYTQIVLNPDLDFGGWGVGLDLNLEFDKDGKIRTGEWSTWQAVVSKVRYIRIGEKGDEFFMRLGALNNVTIGHGTIMDGFANTLFYPDVRMLGVQLDIDFGFFGVETFTENALDLDIFAGRAYFRPFSGLFEKLHIGFTYVTDTDTQNPIMTGKNKYDFSDADGGKTATVYGIDVGLPLPSLGILTWTWYADYMQVATKGSGFSTGLMGELAFIFNWKLELNRFAPGFSGTYFDAFYMAERATKLDSLDSVTDPYNGWKFMIWRNFSIMKTDDLTISLLVKDSDADGIKPMMVFGVHVDRKLLFDKVEFDLSYTKKNIPSFGDAFKIEGLDTVINMSFGYMIAKNVMLTVLYTKTFMDDPDNPGTLKGQEATSVQTQLKF